MNGTYQMRNATVISFMGLALLLGGCGAGEKKEATSIGDSNGERVIGNSSLNPRTANPVEDAKRQENSSMGNADRPRGRNGLTGGAFSETHQTTANRGPLIVLPRIFGVVPSRLDKALPKKQKVACIVVEQKYLRKVKTRGVCKTLRNQNPDCEIFSFEGLKQDQTLQSLLVTARSQKADILVILEKKTARSFVLLDTRNAVLLGYSSGTQQHVLPGNKSLLALHGTLCKLWSSQ